MQRLSLALANLVDALAPEQRKKLADAFRTAAPETLEAVVDQAWTPSDATFNALKKAVKSELRRTPDVSGTTLSFALQTANEALERRDRNTEKLELVWTGPRATSVPIRQTEQVLCGLVNEARKRLFLASFVVYRAPSVLDALRVAHDRAVKISFILEPTTEEGGKVVGDSVETLQKTLPRARFYRRRDFAPDEPLSNRAHAKCAVADASLALITSANLTGKAMTENMELGVLVRGGKLPKQLRDHLEALVAENIVVPY